MRTMMRVSIPVGPGNRSISDGSLPATFNTFVEQFKPEASYFTAFNGERTAIFVFDLTDSSSIPSICETFFQVFEASIEIAPVMNADDLKKGLAKLPAREGAKTERNRTVQAQQR
jgi:hypothetical protein